MLENIENLHSQGHHREDKDDSSIHLPQLSERNLIRSLNRGKKLTRLGVKRFATNYLTLQRILKAKATMKPILFQKVKI